MAFELSDAGSRAPQAGFFSSRQQDGEGRSRRGGGAFRWLLLVGALLALGACEAALTEPAGSGDGTTASLEVAPAEAEGFPGDTIHFDATVVDGSGEAVSGYDIGWSSSDSDLVSVDADGVATVQDSGSATLTATATSTSASEDTELTASVQVRGKGKKAASLEVTPAEATVEAGATVQLKATVRDGNGDVLDRNVQFASSDEGVATVDGDGTVTGEGAGTAEIVGRSGSTRDTATITVEGGSGGGGSGSGSLVTELEPTAYETDTLETGISVYVDRDYTIDGVPASVSGSPYIRTANDDKNTTGDSVVTFELTDSATVAVAYDERATQLPDWLADWTATGDSLRTTDIDYAIYERVFAPGTIVLGGNLSGGADGASSMYLVLASRGGASAGDGGGGSDGGTSDSVASISVSPTSATLSTLGTTRQFSAEARNEAGELLSGVSFSWSSSNTAVATVDADGTATAQAEGSAQIIASAQDIADSAAVSVDTSSSGGSEVAIPLASSWTDHGIVVPLGPSGAWDHRIDGSFTPSTVLKIDGVLHLYYVGADGDRTSDGGPANRALGVATSTDGINWTKYSGNPVITHQPDQLGDGTNVEEEGVFSAGIVAESGGPLHLYYGGMGATSSSGVDSDGLVQSSSDGLAFSGATDVIRHDDPDVHNNGDEMFPTGAIRDDQGVYHVYYVSKGTLGSWLLSKASGSAFDNMTSYTGVLTSDSPDWKCGCDPIRLSDTKVLVPVSTTWDIQMRTTTIDALEDLSTVATTYARTTIHSNLKEWTLYLDRELERWFLYYVTTDNDGVHLKTAPMTLK